MSMILKMSRLSLIQRLQFKIHGKTDARLRRSKWTDTCFLTPREEAEILEKYKRRKSYDSRVRSLNEPIENEKDDHPFVGTPAKRAISGPAVFQLGSNREGGEVQHDTALILKGLGIATRALSTQSSEQNAQLIQLLLKSQQEITMLRDDLIDSQQRQADLLLQVQKLTLQIAKTASDKEDSEKEKQALREKKRTRKKKPLKDPFDLSDLLNVLNIIKEKYKDPMLSSRYRICVTLLYLFGIRVNELRQIKVGHVHQYLEGQPLNLQIGKTKIRSKVSFPSAKGTRDFLKRYCATDLDFVLHSLSHEVFLAPVSREHLTRELNSLIKEYGVTVHKTLLSHSCRVSFITRVCKNSGIEAARAMVGHAHISTTQVYNRNYLSSRAQQRIFNDSLKESKDHFDSSELDTLLDQEDLD